MKILLINASVRADSRTKMLTDYLLLKLKGEVETIDLKTQKLQPLDDKTLAQRDALIKEKHFDYPMFDLAKQFMAADIIVMCAPMWDLSFPAMLKTFVEHINVSGLVFKYGADGRIISNCQAKVLYYVTTMGGYYTTDFGFGYIKALCDMLYQIKNVYLIKAEGLDIVGNDAAAALEKAKREIDDLVK
ncbi:MAG: NAD(P)H-dependent oxidoreductase [Alphaproteobacteria bacterium]|nr:NAD(P)H-dependent oxidoreductase [Alphaproteobacteria bacterium]